MIGWESYHMMNISTLSQQKVGIKKRKAAAMYIENKNRPNKLNVQCLS